MVGGCAGGDGSSVASRASWLAVWVSAERNPRQPRPIPRSRNSYAQRGSACPSQGRCPPASILGLALLEDPGGLETLHGSVVVLSCDSGPRQLAVKWTQ